MGGATTSGTPAVGSGANPTSAPAAKPNTVVAAGTCMMIFQNLRLTKALIAEPPIELWPQVVTRVAVPEDLETLVLAQLRQG